MKKGFYFIIGMMLMTLTSCEKFLTHDHPTSISDEEFWRTEADATNALNTAYVGIPDGASGRQILFLSAMADENVSRQSFRGDYESYVKGLQNGTWGVGLGIWRDDYKTIRRANRFLENVDKCYMDEELKTRFKYEARALRAYYHMELLLFFGGVPLMTKSVVPDASYLKRNTEKEVYDFVLAELTECAGKLPKEYTNADIKRITSGVCWALITRLATFYKHYEVAKNAAKEVIKLDIYALYKSATPKNSYADLFLYTGELNKERIFFRENGCSGAWDTFAPQGLGGKTVLSPTAAMINSYETKQGKTIYELGPDSLAIYLKDPKYKNNRDPRLAFSVLFPLQTYASLVLKPFDLNPLNSDKIGAQNSTATGYWQNKYLDPKDKTGSKTLDFMIIRYAEVLLTYVETLIETDDFANPDVVKYLNEIRNRAGMPNVNVAVYNTKDKLRELVRRERRVELAFEGVRYYDIRRWGIFEEVMNGAVTGAIDPLTSIAVPVETRSAKANRDFLWPIPQLEIQANPGINQNPNY